MAEHILVGLSSAPSNARIIRTAATMANAFGGTFTALFVRTPNYEAMSEENKERLRQNTSLAQELGATIETVFGAIWVSFSVSVGLPKNLRVDIALLPTTILVTPDSLAYSAI